MKKEADVKAAVKKVLGAFGDKVWWFMPVPTGFGVQGVPDFIVCVNGQFLGVETKFGKNELTAWQVKQMLGIAAAKGAHMTVNERNVEDLRAMLEAMVAMGD